MAYSRSLDSFKPTSPIAKAIAVILIFVGAAVTYKLAFFYYGPVVYIAGYAPEQPIPFSHKLHAGEREIDCQYCHTYARRSEMSGIPSLAKCNNCHSNLTKESEAINTLKSHIESNTPIEWVKVFDLPDHVWFSHKRHIKKGFKCQQCHGEIQTMDVVKKSDNFKMGFCVDCHQEHEAPTDCWTCHT